MSLVRYLSQYNTQSLGPASTSCPSVWHILLCLQLFFLFLLLLPMTMGLSTSHRPPFAIQFLTLWSPTTPSATKSPLPLAAPNQQLLRAAVLPQGQALPVHPLKPRTIRSTGIPAQSLFSHILTWSRWHFVLVPIFAATFAAFLRQRSFCMERGSGMTMLALSDQPSEDDILKMTVQELKQTLKGLGLKVTGNKKDLTQRLLEYMDESSDSEGSNQNDDDSGDNSGDDSDDDSDKDNVPTDLPYFKRLTSRLKASLQHKYWACEEIAEIAKNEPRAEGMVEAGVLLPLISMLESKDTMSQAHAAEAIAIIAHHRSLVPHLLSAGVMAPLLKVALVNDFEVRMTVGFALRHLSQNYPDSLRFQVASYIEESVKMLHSKCDNEKRSALLRLEYLIQADVDRIAAGSAGAVEPLIALMHSPDMGIRLAATSALAIFVGAENMNHYVVEQVMAAGGLASVVKVLNEERQLKFAAMKVLLRICENEEYRQHVIQAGALPAMLELIAGKVIGGSHMGARHRAIVGLWHLGKDATNLNAMVVAGLIPAVGKCIQNLMEIPKDGECLAYCLAMVNRLATNAERRRQIIDSGAVAIMLQILPEQDESIQETLREVLEKVTTED